MENVKCANGAKFGCKHNRRWSSQGFYDFGSAVADFKGCWATASMKSQSVFTCINYSHGGQRDDCSLAKTADVLRSLFHFENAVNANEYGSVYLVWCIHWNVDQVQE